MRLVLLQELLPDLSHPGSEPDAANHSGDGHQDGSVLSHRLHLLLCDHPAGLPRPKRGRQTKDQLPPASGRAVLTSGGRNVESVEQLRPQGLSNPRGRPHRVLPLRRVLWTGESQRGLGSSSRSHHVGAASGDAR